MVSWELGFDLAPDGIMGNDLAPGSHQMVSWELRYAPGSHQMVSWELGYDLAPDGTMGNDLAPGSHQMAPWDTISLLEVTRSYHGICNRQE